jgi:hypothetical protein
LIFHLVSFWAFLGKGSSKTPYKMFLQKVHAEKLSQNNRPKIQTEFFSILFIAFVGVS